MSELYLPEEEDVGWGESSTLPSTHLWGNSMGCCWCWHPPHSPITYQVPKQEDEDAHHQRAQPEETQAPIALPAESVRSEPSTQPPLNPPPTLSPPALLTAGSWL